MGATRQTARYRRRDAQQKRAFDGRAVGRKADVIEQLPEAIAWAEAQGPGRHSVARRLRAAGRRLVSAPRQCLIEAEFDARELQRSALYLGTLIWRHRGFFGPCAAQPRRCGRPKWGFPSFGHVPGVTARYAHIPDRALLAAADQVSARIAAALDSKAGAKVIEVGNHLAPAIQA
jgi:hypothetical protein